MRNLSTDQVKYIRENIAKNGVHSAELLNELTDHICSIIELKEFETDEEFYSVHKQVIREFKPENFALIQYLSNQIINHKNSNKMKTIRIVMFSLAIYATFVMLVSFFLESNNMGSAQALRMTSFIVYASLIILLTYFLVRFKKESATVKIIGSIGGYLLAFVLISLGVRQINLFVGDSLLLSVPYLLFGLSLIGTILFINQTISSKEKV